MCIISLGIFGKCLVVSFIQCSYSKNKKHWSANPRRTALARYHQLMGWAVIYVYSWSSASSRSVWHGLATVVESMPSVETTWASKVRRASTGKPVLIFILSLFTWFSRHNFWTQCFYENRQFKIKQMLCRTRWCRLLAILLCLVAENGNGHKDTQTHRPSTWLGSLCMHTEG